MLIRPQSFSGTSTTPQSLAILARSQNRITLQQPSPARKSFTRRRFRHQPPAAKQSHEYICIQSSNPPARSDIRYRQRPDPARESSSPPHDLSSIARYPSCGSASRPTSITTVQLVAVEPSSAHHSALHVPLALHILIAHRRIKHANRSDTLQHNAIETAEVRNPPRKITKSPSIGSTTHVQSLTAAVFLTQKRIMGRQKTRPRTSFSTSHRYIR